MLRGKVVTIAVHEGLRYRVGSYNLLKLRPMKLDFSISKLLIIKPGSELA